MTEHFRTEPIDDSDQIRVYTRSNENLPIKIDCNTRFSVLKNTVQDCLEQIRDFEVRKDDIWVITPPKSGTTWMLELVWLLQNDLDFETALKIDQEKRTSFLEICSFLPNSVYSIENYDALPSPRIMKSHLPVHLLPKGLWTVKPKVIFVARNPKDAIVSFFHHHTSLGAFKGSKEEYVNGMLSNRIRYAPFAEIIFEFWQLRNEPYIYFTSFERMKKDLRSVVVGVSAFLGKSIPNEQEMSELLDHLSFKKMKDNRRCNHLTEGQMLREHFGSNQIQNDSWFVRKGAVDSYKAELDENARERLEKWFEEQFANHSVTPEELFLS